MNTFGRILLGTTALGTATVGYAAGIERLHFTLRHATLPVLPENARPLRILHISDLHMMPNQAKKQRWVAALAELEPDLVINTGDNLAHPRAVPTVVRALDPLLDFPGMFVFGSNDYYAPKPKNPFRYLIPAHKTKRIHGTQLPWRDLRAAMTERGWQDLTHLRHTVNVSGVTVTASGVDDPHLKRDRYDEIAGRPGPQTQLSIGVTHSPEPRILDSFEQDGYDLVLAGHTHGGQVCVPFYGALVTNCGIDHKRVKGASQWGERMWLHVSAGLGTSPYTAVRLACPPEASLLTLVPRSQEVSGRAADAKAPTRFGAGVEMR